MRFEKISKEQFDKDFRGYHDLVKYEDIKLPVRSTKLSAGYDFFTPVDINLNMGASMKIPTGIRVKLDDDKFLALVPRSGLGFKYRLQLDNTLGVIDADYYYADNEGHIFIKITNDNRESKILNVKTGEAFAQGIILQYFKVDGDNDDDKAKRHGGIGSTDAGREGRRRNI